MALRGPRLPGPDPPAHPGAAAPSRALLRPLRWRCTGEATEEGGGVDNARELRVRSMRGDTCFLREETPAARLGAADPEGLRGRPAALSVRGDDEDSHLPDRSTRGAQDPPASRGPELRGSERSAVGGTRAFGSRLLTTELPEISDRGGLVSDLGSIRVRGGWSRMETSSSQLEGRRGTRAPFQPLRSPRFRLSRIRERCGGRFDPAQNPALPKAKP